MAEKTSGFEKEMEDYFIQSGISQGMDEGFARLFATLYSEPEEITLEELARKTGYSLASISNKLRLMENTGFVRRTCKPGSKRIYVHMEKDFMELMKRHLITKQEKIITAAKQNIPNIINRYHDKMRNDHDRKKMKILENYYKQVQKVEKIIPKMIKLMDEADK